MANKKVHLKILRQKDPDSKPYWESFEVPYKEKLNVVSALMEIQSNPVNIKGEKVNPVVWECNCLEEVCGACTMMINGEPKQGCSALIDNLKQPIRLEPLTKFPVVRDLMIDRQKMFDALEKIKGWIPIDGTFPIHQSAPRISPKEWDLNYEFSRCMTCGCCMEACPQYSQNMDFIGPAPLGQTWLFNQHPTGKYSKEERLHAIMGKGGITDCGNAQNCIEVCPKEISLTKAIGDLGRQTTFQFFKDILLD